MNRAAKGNSGTLLVLAALVVVVILAMNGTLSGLLHGLIPGFSISGSSQVDVTKQIQFSAVNQFSGAASASKTLYLYNDQGVLIETITTPGTAGIYDSAKSYTSGTQLYVKYDGGSNSMEWYSLTVPKMNSADAQANTYINVDLATYTIGTYSSPSLTEAALNLVTTSPYEVSGNTTNPIFTLKLTNTGVDNTGLVDSQDPVYHQAWQTWVEVKIAGANYETIQMSGFDQQAIIGSTQYGWIRVNADALTKWKVGSTYKPGYQGNAQVSFSLDETGYTGTAGTMTITVYTFYDPTYALAHGGNGGIAKVSIASMVIHLW